MIKKMFLFLIICQVTLISQTDYLMNLTNPVQSDSKSLEFEIKIKSLGTDFLLSSYQCSLTFNLNLLQSDSISLEYINNSSELGNLPLNIIGYDSTDGMNKLIFVSGIGSDSISQVEKIVGKFRIYSSVDFSVDNLNLMWNFEGSANTILTGTNFADITVPTNHLNFDNSITNINSQEITPNKFELNQNYPNPFNPATKIDFTLPQKGNVKLNVFNMLGQKVKQLLNKELSAGKHSIEFNGSNLASGTYIYKINVAGKYLKAKKMILIK